MCSTSNTRSIYIRNDLWERLQQAAQRTEGLSTSQLIENILSTQINTVEAHLEYHRRSSFLCQPSPTS